jgi:hypothetical protein
MYHTADSPLTHKPSKEEIGDHSCLGLTELYLLKLLLIGRHRPFAHS